MLPGALEKLLQLGIRQNGIRNLLTLGRFLPLRHGHQDLTVLDGGAFVVVLDSR